MLLKTVFLKTLHDMRGALAWWAGGMGVTTLWFVTFFPAISGSTALAQYMDSLPDGFMAMFGISDAMLVTTLPGFLTMELMSAWLPGLVIAFALSFGASLLSREEDEGSLDLLLSNPVPRWRVALAKFMALVMFTAIVAVACWLGLLAGVVIIDADPSELHLAEAMLSMTALGVFFAALAYCLTCLKRGRGLAMGVSAGLAVATFFSYNMGDLAKLPEWTEKLSPWFYFHGNSVLVDGLDWGHFGVLIGLSAALILLGAWGFSQRDLGT